MSEAVKNVLYIIAGGILLVVGVVLFRVILKFAWKVVRVILLLLSVLLVAGYFFGFLDISFQF
jgi:energy-coupling factor transporter transmembrane protein EcfT